MITTEGKRLTMEELAAAIKAHDDEMRRKFKESPEEARKEALETLISTGVLTESGKPKKHIVTTWDD